MLGRIFLPISLNDALQIASQSLENDVQGVRLRCHGRKLDNCRIYNVPSEPCWYIYPSWSDNKEVIAIRSSRVILVGKLTGIIHFDGSAGDEG